MNPTPFPSQRYLQLTLRICRAENAEGPCQDLSVKVTDCTIGRAGCAIVLDDPFCSARHASIFSTDQGELRLRDLGSRNGTIVNGFFVHETSLDAGDVIQIGDTRLELVSWSYEFNLTQTQVVHQWPDLAHCSPPKEKRG